MKYYLDSACNQSGELAKQKLADKAAGKIDVAEVMSSLKEAQASYEHAIFGTQLGEEASSTAGIGSGEAMLKGAAKLVSDLYSRMATLGFIFTSSKVVEKEQPEASKEEVAKNHR